MPGLEPFRRTNLSHPGVCEPIDSRFCKEFNDVRVVLEPVHCAALQRGGNPTEVLDLTIRRQGAVSARKDDQFGCVYRDYPLGTEPRDLVAARFAPDNLELMLSMELFGCNAEDAAPSTRRLRGKHTIPHTCIDVYCEDLLMMWKVGTPKLFCIDEEFKFTFGDGGYDKMFVRWRFRNVMGHSGLEDHSSLVLYWNHPDDPPALNHTGFMHYWGSHAVAIPAGFSDYRHAGVGLCPEECTRRYGDPFNITHLVPLMLRHGRYIRVTQSRTGEFSHKVILETDRFDYDSFPKIHRMEPPVLLYPGDEIYVDCGYDTSRARGPAMDGFVDPVHGEHCLIGIRGDNNLSKRDGVNFCKSNNGLGACSRAAEIGEGKLGDCHYSVFLFKVYDKTKELRAAGCDARGLRCVPSCKPVIDELVATEPCLVNKLTFPHMLRLSSHGSMEFVNMLMSCSAGSTQVVRPTQVWSGECGAPRQCLLTPIRWDRHIIP